MICRDVEDTLSLYTAGLLEKDEIQPIEEHLKTCGHCREYLELEKEVQEQLECFIPELPIPDELEDLEEKVTETIQSQTVSIPAQSGGRRWLAAAAVVVLAIVLTFFLPARKSEPVIVKGTVEPLIRELNIQKVTIIQPEIIPVDKSVTVKKVKDNIVLITLKN